MNADSLSFLVLEFSSLLRYSLIIILNIQGLAHTFIYFSTCSSLTIRHIAYLDTNFLYTLFIPCGRLVIQPASFRSLSFAKPLPARCSFIFGNRKSQTVPGPDYTEDARRCSNGIVHAARLVSAGQYADVYCRATEKFHARACPFGKII